MKTIAKKWGYNLSGKLSGKLAGIALAMCMLALLPQQGTAEEGVFPEELTLDNIVVSGNKRSKDRFIKHIVIDCSAKGKNVVLIKQCLEGSLLFKDVEVSVNAQNQLDVKLKDKLTFLGFPIILGPDEESGAEGSTGLVLFDINSGGKGDLFVLTLDQRMPSGESTYDLSYTFNYLGARRANSFGLRAYQSAYLHQQFSGRQWVYGTEEESTGFELSFSHPAGPAGLDWYLGYANSEFDENFVVNNPERPLSEESRDTNPDDLADELVSFTKITPGFGYTIANAGRGSYYTSGIVFSQKLLFDSYSFKGDEEEEEDGESGITVTTTGEDPEDNEDPNNSDIRLESNFYLGVPSVGNQVFQLYLKHEIRERDNAFGSYKIGNIVGSRGLPNNGIWGKEYGYIALEYQIPVLQKKSYVWTFTPFIDNGYATGIPTDTNPTAADNGNDEFDVALTDSINWVSGGIINYVHFIKEPVPALGFFIAANGPNTGVGLQVGASF